MDAHCTYASSSHICFFLVEYFCGFFSSFFSFLISKVKVIQLKRMMIQCVCKIVRGKNHIKLEWVTMGTKAHQYSKLIWIYMYISSTVNRQHAWKMKTKRLLLLILIVVCNCVTSASKLFKKRMTLICRMRHAICGSLCRYH